MACGSCGTTENGVPNGCKSNGNCASGTCGSGSKLNVFDWLSNMTLPSGQAINYTWLTVFIFQLVCYNENLILNNICLGLKVKFDSK
jgi:hypothetical protein